MAKRTNEQWITALDKPGQDRETALVDLQKILVSGLRRGLLSQINTSAPEFESLAEDFVQEALLKIINKLHTFAGRAQFTTWAHKIAVSVALTELRRKRWKDKSLDGIVETESGDYTPSFMADPLPTPDNATERAEMLHQVERLINNALTEKQRQALVMSTIEGKSASEVAQKMQMKPNAVYKLLHDARLRLKRSLAEEGMTPSDVLAVF
ncbi:MAG: RNA polymerase sigma factor [Chloroflexi bacterium]|nr:RNA polymerase sigma factor [Chloroflexota bacterium]